MNSSANEEALARLVSYWQTLTPQTVAALDRYYTADAYFRDPFNRLHGVEPIRRVFDDMFVRLEEPRFLVVHTILQGDEATLIWDFDFRIKSFRPQVKRRIQGLSHIRFAADGRVAYHRDYWDAAGELYEQFPLIGPLLRWLKKRMA